MAISGEELTAADLMQVQVRTVPSEMGLPDLENALLEARVGGFPVVDTGRKLLGIVSRSDVVRAICHEREMAHAISDFYRDDTGFHEIKMESFKDIADRVGERIEGLTVKDVMVTPPRTIRVDEPISRVASVFVDQQIHRLPVVDGADLVGIITTMDLVRLISQRRLREPAS